MTRSAPMDTLAAERSSPGTVRTAQLGPPVRRARRVAMRVTTASMRIYITLAAVLRAILRVQIAVTICRMVTGPIKSTSRLLLPTVPACRGVTPWRTIAVSATAETRRRIAVGSAMAMTPASVDGWMTRSAPVDTLAAERSSPGTVRTAQLGPPVRRARRVAMRVTTASMRIYITLAAVLRAILRVQIAVTICRMDTGPIKSTSRLLLLLLPTVPALWGVTPWRTIAVT